MESIDILVLCLEIKHQRRKRSGDNEIVVEAWIGGVRSAWHLQDHLLKHLICWSWSLVSYSEQIFPPLPDVLVDGSRTEFLAQEAAPQKESALHQLDYT